MHRSNGHNQHQPNARQFISGGSFQRNRNPSQMLTQNGTPTSPTFYNAQTDQRNMTFSQGTMWERQGIVPPSFVPSTQTASSPSRLWGQKKNRWVIIASLFCVVALLGAITFFWIEAQGTTKVVAYQVGTQNVTQVVGGGGIIYPRQQLTISYPIDERVVAVFVKPGDQVTMNESLIQLDPSQLNAQITLAANDLAAAQAYLDSVSVSGNSVTIAQAQQAYNLARNKYNALVAEAASPTLHNGDLIAPMNGVVTSVKINPGEVFTADSQLITIMDESTVIAHVEVPLSDLGQIHIGQAATVTPSALPNLTFPGTVSTIIPNANPQTDTFEIWVTIDNRDKNLLPGMSAFVRIQSSGQALVVPRLAVLNPDRESCVFLLKDDHAYLQRVQTAGYADDTILITSGLSRGDKVVLVGLATLQNGQKVHITRTEG